MTTTARDLALVALGLPTGRVERGDLSLALAGAEAIDLMERGALTLDGERIVPGLPVTTGDRLLDEAGAALDRRQHETVEDWLWRRGEGLAVAYVQDLQQAGAVAGPQGTGRAAAPEQQQAEERRASGEPVLTGLLDTLGAGDTPEDLPEEIPDADTDADADRSADAADQGGSDDTGDDDPVTTVLAAVGDAVTQLEAQRLRRNIENDAFDNVWRGY